MAAGWGQAGGILGMRWSHDYAWRGDKRKCVVLKSVYMTADIFCIRIITNDYSSSVKDNIHDACFHCQIQI